MPKEPLASAFSSDEQVRHVALRISGMSEAIHHTLRQLAQTLPQHDSSAAYMLLTEEYALRARINILQIEARRFVRTDFPIAQDEVVRILDEVDRTLAAVRHPDELTELIVSLVMFATSIACRNNSITILLLRNLEQLATVGVPNK
jgi:hypothetical protein